MKNIILCFFTLFGIHAIGQQAGNLDLTFSGDGIQVVELGSSTVSTAMGIQSDGKIILTFIEENMQGGAVRVARFLEDGTYDSTFGNTGIQTVNFGPGNFGYSMNLTIQSDDKIVIGCSISNEMGEIYYGVVRMDAWGNMDSSFGEGGVVMTEVDLDPLYGGMNGIAQQPDGKILVFGTTSMPMNNQFILFRLMEDGTMDDSFGNGEFVYVNATMYGDSPFRAYFTSDDKIVIGGSTLVPTGGLLDPAYEDILIVRLNMDGTPDETFGEEGRLMANLDDMGDQCSHIVVMEDGSIYAAGYITDGDTLYTNGITDFLLCKFTPEGNFDTSFGTDGYLQYDLAGSNDILTALVKDENGNLILIGFTSIYPEYTNVALLRVLPDGTPDATFGENGKVMEDYFGSLDEVTTAQMTSDNKILVCGKSNIEGDVWATVSRYHNSDVIISVNESFQNEISLFPNPFDEGIYIRDSKGLMHSCRIYDTSGNLVVEMQQNSHFQMNTSALSDGVYEIQITRKDGIVEHHKLIKL